MQLPWSEDAMFNELMFDMITQLPLPCLVNHCFCHACSVAVGIFKWNALAMFNEMQLPCLMHCTSTRHVVCKMPMPKWKCCVVAMFTELHFAMFYEMQVDMFPEMQKCHICSTEVAMFNKCSCHVLCTVLPLGMLVWKWQWPVENDMQLPCLMYYSCHV